MGLKGKSADCSKELGLYDSELDSYPFTKVETLVLKKTSQVKGLVFGVVLFLSF